MTKEVKKREGPAPTPESYHGIRVYAADAAGKRHPCRLLRFTCVYSMAGPVSAKVPLVVEFEDGVADEADRMRLVKRLTRMGYEKVVYVKVSPGKEA